MRCNRRNRFKINRLANILVFQFDLLGEMVSHAGCRSADGTRYYIDVGRYRHRAGEIDVLDGLGGFVAINWNEVKRHFVSHQLISLFFKHLDRRRRVLHEADEEAAVHMKIDRSNKFSVGLDCQD